MSKMITPFQFVSVRVYALSGSGLYIYLSVSVSVCACGVSVISACKCETHTQERPCYFQLCLLFSVYVHVCACVHERLVV